jgi:hypothetical protein
MKPSREEIKRIIRETISPAFVPLGFANPGISMWRWREVFVDVLHFYMPSNTTDFAIEVGCHPRKFVRPHPLPWVCIFRYRIGFTDKNNRYIYWFETQDTVEKEREMLLEITPLIRETALSWWSKFSTIEKAIEMLVSSSEAELDQITFPRKGSIAFAKNLAILQYLTSTQK